MRLLPDTSSGTTSNGVTAHEFVHNDVPGVFWSPADTTDDRPLVLLAHGGGSHRKGPGLESRAHRYVRECGFSVLALDAPGHGDRPRTERDEQFTTEIRRRFAGGEPVGELVGAYNAMLADQAVPEWRAVLDALGADGPVGFWGVSMGATIGIRVVAAEPRIRAAVFGLSGGESLHEAASEVGVPVRFLVQWDDQVVPREAALALFDAFGTPVKSLHANPGGHGEVPAVEEDSAHRFFRCHLTGCWTAENSATTAVAGD